MPPGISAPDNDLIQRREDIRLGLARSNTATMVALLVSVGLACATVFYAFEARQANHRMREELRNAQQARATALRLSSKAGRRQEGLKAIAEAVRIRPSPELRDEAIALLPLVDMEPGDFWRPLPPEDTVLAISTQQEVYATGDNQGRVRIRRMHDDTEIGLLSLSNRMMCLEFSPDGCWLAAHSQGGTLCLWDVVRCQTVMRSELPPGDFNEHSLAFHPDGNQLAVCAPGQVVRIFSTKTGQEHTSLRIDAPPAAVCFDAAGRFLAIGANTRIQLWDFWSRQMLRTLEVRDRIIDLAWHPQTRHFAFATADGRVVLVSPEGTQLQPLYGHSSLVNRVLFDPSGTVLVSTSWDGTTRFWSAHSGSPLFVSQAGFARQFDSTGQRLFYVKEGIGFGDWSFIGGTALRVLPLPRDGGSKIFSLDFSPNDRWLAVAALNGVHIYDSATGQPVGGARLAYANGIAFADDGETLLVSSASGLHRLTCRFDGNGNLVGLGEATPLTKDSPSSYTLGFVTRGARRFFVAGSESHVAIVDLASPESARIKNMPGDVNSIAMSPDGGMLVTSIWKGIGTRVWSLEKPSPTHALNDEGGIAAFSPDGQWLVVGTGKRYLFYDSTHWQVQREVPRDSASALSGVVSFHPDGNVIAVTHTLRQIRLLEMQTSRTLASLEPPAPERITALGFSRDGLRLAAATSNAEVHLWNLQQVRQELQLLGLDLCPEGTRSQGGELSMPRYPHRWALWFSSLGAGLALLFALYTIRHHRQLVDAYEAVELVSEQRRREIEITQARLIHSQKMKALGTLAAGIAHDFNNLLSVIRMSGKLVHRQLKPDGLARDNLEAIERAVVQGKNIVGSILGYSRHTSDPAPLYEVNQVVRDTLKMLNSQYLSGIILTLELESQIPPVLGDASRLEQILLNLIVNANEAMKGRGQLTLSTCLRKDLPPCVLAVRPADSYIELGVRDSGPGIPPEILPRIFEPFFTTKNSGTERGTGLGLTSIFTIARQDGLGLAVESRVNQGTTFCVLIPVEMGPTDGP